MARRRKNEWTARPVRKAYSVADLAKLLGVSRDTIYRMRNSRELPDTIPTERRLIRWTVEDIELWFDLDCPRTNIFLRHKKDLQRRRRGRWNKA